MSIAKLKADFRASCEHHGVDPEYGSTTFQAANVKAEQQKRTHHQRMRRLVINHAERRPLCFDNGRGAVDTIKVEMRAMRNWWHDKELWVQGDSRLSQVARVDLLLGVLRINGYVVSPNDTEFEAIDRLLTQAKAAESESRRRREEVEIVPVETIVAGVMRDLLREIMRERWAELRGSIPLKQLHARQRDHTITNEKLTCQGAWSL